MKKKAPQNNKLKLLINPQVDKVYHSYPETARNKLLHLRNILLEVAAETEGISRLEETLKWGEPSYLVKSGSTIRMAWKKDKPDQYAVYFKCTSKLVPAFKVAYGDLFNFEGNRALHFQLSDKIPEPELRICFKTALTYHKVKHLDLLGLI